LCHGNFSLRFFASLKHKAASLEHAVVSLIHKFALHKVAFHGHGHGHGIFILAMHPEGI
jgi:hypothetical protein